MDVEQNIKAVLSRFDTTGPEKFAEYQIDSELRSCIPDEMQKINSGLLAELLAFAFTENYQDQASGWGTYFGPKMVLGNDQGEMVESPSIRKVTPEIIEHWRKRAFEVINPILKARYAGLVWDLSEKICGSRPSHTIGQLYISSLLEIATKDIHKHQGQVFEKLRRALSLSISMSSGELIERSKRVIVQYENIVAIDGKPGLSGHAYDLLVGNKKAKLDAETEKAIIEDLEAKLLKVSSEDSETQKVDPWAAEAIAVRLANYYRKKAANEDMRRVLLRVSMAYYQIIDEASPLQASGWLEQLHNLFNDFNLQEEAEQVLLKIREIGPKVNAELKPISTSFEIPREKIDNYLNQMHAGEPEIILQRIAVKHIPSKDHAKDQVLNLSKVAPIQYLIGHKIQDNKGRVVASIGPLENDLEGHMVRQISQNLSFSSLFMRMIYEQGIDRKLLSEGVIMNYLLDSPIIANDRFEIIKRGLKAFFEGDYLVSIHLLIPQIEEAIRNILEMSGGKVLRSKAGAFQLRTFDDVLRDAIITNALGEDMSHYFRILFTDQRGWNLRNDVCHGLVNINAFNSQNTDRVVHALLCLGLVRAQEE